MNNVAPRRPAVPSALPLEPPHGLRDRPSILAPELEPDSVISREGACFEPDERLAMIAEAAYYRAEQRGFDPGHEIEDWLAAEAAVDASLERADAPTVRGE